MIEIWLFGYLVVTLGSATALVLLLVALASVAYLAITLIPALAVGGSARVGLRVGVAVALVALLLSLAALRAGTPGSMGELLPTFALAVALAAAVGSAAALAWVGLARILRSAQEAATGRARRLDGARVDQVRRLETDRRAYLDGTDLVREVAEADDAVLRLRTALDRLERTRDDLQSRLVALGEDAAAGDLGRELRGARDDVAAKLDLGGKILRAAEAAAFRVACGAPVKWLLRRRPRDAMSDVSAATIHIEPAAETLRTFLVDASAARHRLSLLEARREARDPDGAGDAEDPWARAVRDVDAVTRAYAAVLDRLDVVRVRLSARAQLDAVATAAGEVSDRAQSSGLADGDLSELVGEVTRAELAITMATPGDFDTHTLTDALARSTLAHDRSDGGSLDDLLRAMRELA